MLSSSGSSSASSDSSLSRIDLTKYIKEAKIKLSWEIVEGKEQRPTLNLSSSSSSLFLQAYQDLSLSEAAQAAIEVEGDNQTLQQDDEKKFQRVNNNNNDDDDVVEKQKASKENEHFGYESWEDGTIWFQTRVGLERLGILNSTFPSIIHDDSEHDINDDNRDSDNRNVENEAICKLLQAAPQLLRLDTALVLETAQTLLNCLDDNHGDRFRVGDGGDGGIETIQKEPILLTYRSDDVLYGLEFLQTMMAIPDSSKSIIVRACLESPKLLVSAIEGGLQERAVKRALSAAGDATLDASKRVVSDGASTWRQLRDVLKRGGGGGGG